MLRLLSMALAISAASVLAEKTQLPPTFELFALDTHNHSQIGCVTSSGNFTTNTLACFPFRAFPTSAIESEIVVFGTPCSADDAFACPSTGDDGIGLFTVSISLEEFVNFSNNY